MNRLLVGMGTKWPHVWPSTLILYLKAQRLWLFGQTIAHLKTATYRWSCATFICFHWIHISKKSVTKSLCVSTHMVVDSIHSLLERDWLQLSRISGRNNDCKVYEMTPDFKDFNVIYCTILPIQHSKISKKLRITKVFNFANSIYASQARTSWDSELYNRRWFAISECRL